MASFKSLQKMAGGSAGGSAIGAVNETPEHYLKYPKRMSGPPTICTAVDLSGSMQAEMSDYTRDQHGSFDSMVRDNMRSLYSMFLKIDTVTYGPGNTLPREVTEIVDGEFRVKRVLNLSVVSSYPDFDSQFIPDGPTSAHKLQYLTPANAYVLIGDGALDDPDVWERHLQDHVRKGTFKHTTHMVFVFAPHTTSDDKHYLIDDMRQMLRTAGIGCEVLVFDTLTHRNHLVEIMTPIMDTYKAFHGLAENYLQVSNIMAFHMDMLPNVLGNCLKVHNPRVLHQLLDKVKSMAQHDPQSLNDDPVWAKIHKALIVAFADQPFQYKDWMSEYKRGLRMGTPQRSALDKLYKDSFKDDAKIRKLLSEVDHDKIIGFLVVDGSADIDEDNIINAIRIKCTLLGAIKEMRNHMKFQRRNGLEIDMANLPGMPILDTRIASPKECRAMFQLLFIQWTQASLDQMLQWIAAMCLLTSSGRAVDPEIVAMVEKSFFDAEKHTIKVLGLSEDGIDADKREILFYPPITKMLAEVLARHKKKMFPITLGGREGESLVSRRVLMDQINIWKKVSQLHSFIQLFRDAARAKITRKVTQVITPGTDTIASDLAHGDVVEFCNLSSGRSRYSKNKRARQEPWINLPTIGVVVMCRYNYKTKLWEIVIQQLDDEPWNGMFHECNDYLTDSLRFNVSCVEVLNLMVLASIPVDDQEIQMPGAVDPHREMVFEINRYLMGIKAQGGVYHRDAAPVRGVRDELLGHIKGICGSSRAVTREIDIEVEVPLEVIYRGLPVQSGMWPLIKSGANPSMAQILDMIDNPIHTPHDYITGFDYKHSGRKYGAVLTEEEIDQFKDYYNREFKKFNTSGTGLEALNEVECSICYDTAFFRQMVRHPCGHFQCPNCMDSMVKEEYQPGDVVENMHCLCPECRTPIDHPDGRIRDLFTQYPKGLPNGKLFRFCTDMQCGCALFEQDMPCGQGVEFSEVKCEPCRPPPLPCHPCPGCGIEVNKESGCDHITCRCGAHWCWRCGEQFPTGGDTYDHMLSGDCPGGRGYGGGY